MRKSNLITLGVLALELIKETMEEVGQKSEINKMKEEIKEEIKAELSKKETTKEETKED